MQTKFDGVMGPFSFTPGRDPASTEGVVVLVMQGGKFVIAPDVRNACPAACRRSRGGS